MVRVYLDSQDFSRLANLQVGDQLHTTRSKLFELKTQRAAEFGYSYLHVIEVLKPIEGKFSERDRAKGRLMRDLCDSNAFPFFSDLLEGAKFPNDGLWGPRALLEDARAINPAFLVAEETNKLSKERGLNRKRRRALGSQSGQRAIAEWGLAQADRDISGGFGIFSTHDLFKIMKGQGSPRDFQRKLYNALLDPSLYGDILASIGRKNELRIKFEQLEGPQLARISKVISDYQKLFEMAREFEPKLQDSVRRLRELGITGETEPERVLKKIRLDLREALNRVEIPTQMEHIKHYVTHLARQGRSPKTSDYRDLMHLTYAYDADLIRVDKAMAAIFADFAPLKGRIVPSLTELPSRIELVQQA